MRTDELAAKKMASIKHAFAFSPSQSYFDCLKLPGNAPGETLTLAHCRARRPTSPLLATSLSNLFLHLA